MRLRRLAAAMAAGLLLSGPSLAAGWDWHLPPGFPQPIVPADNPMSAAKVALGRRLFHDPRLSGNGTTSCASCHFETLAFSDGRAVSPGATGMSTPRNAPGLFNLAWLSTYTWANPALVSLERQAEVPLFGDDPVEMGVTDANRDEVLGRLGRDPDLVAGFAAAFPDRATAITFETVIKAIAAFERSLIAGQSKYDRFRHGMESLSAEEQQGMDLFFSPRLGCSGCHGGFNFTDQTVAAAAEGRGTPPFHDAGIHGLSGLAYPNRGLFELTGEPADVGKFRAPSLRNVAVTGPYMHDGSVATLEQAVRIFGENRIDHAQAAKISAFLRTLTSR